MMIPITKQKISYTLPVVLLFFIFSETSYSQIESNIPVQGRTQDSLSIEKPFGISIVLGEGVGFLGGKCSYQFSRQWQVVVGGGYYSISLPVLNFWTNTESARREETSLLLMGRFYVIQHFYLTSGLSYKAIYGRLENNGDVSEASFATIGIPVAIGIEIGANDPFAINFEIGYSPYFGKGADDEILIAGGSRFSLRGSTGAWVGVGITGYF